MTRGRFIDSETGIVNANGTCTITFQQPPQGTVNTGTISVINSNTSTLWTVYILGQAVTTLLGSNPCPDVQAFAGEILTVTAENLVPGTVYNAVWLGANTPAETTPIVYPATSAQQTLSSTYTRVLAQGLAGTGGADITLNLQPTDQCLIFLLANARGTVTISVVGNNSECDYETVTVELGAPTGVVTIPCYGSADPTVSVTITSSVGNTNYMILASDDFAVPESGILTNPIVVEIISPDMVAVGGQASGASGNTTILTVPSGSTYYLHTACLACVSSAAYPGGDATLQWGGVVILRCKMLTATAPAVTLAIPPGGIPLIGPTTLAVTTSVAGFASADLVYSTTPI